METKQQIRKRVISQRMALPSEEVEDKSRKIAEQVIAHPWFQTAKHLAVYFAFRNEVDTKAIILRAWEEGKSVYLPKVSGTRMDFFQIHSLEEVTEGAFGNPEPKGGEALCAPDHEILVLMPGTAFDKNGNRLGYGGGYYDRFLWEHPKVRTMAVAYELQILDQIPQEDTDIRPEWLVTERNIYQW